MGIPSSDCMVLCFKDYELIMYTGHPEFLNPEPLNCSFLNRWTPVIVIDLFFLQQGSIGILEGYNRLLRFRV